MASEMTVITYGGGEVLFQLFTGIKMVFDSGFIKTMAYLATTISAVYTIYASYFSSPQEHLIKNFLLPILALIILCFTVKTTVIIEDKLPLAQGGFNWISREGYDDGNKNVGTNIHPSRSVDGVPFIIGFISKGISTIGHKMTVAVENIFHTVDDEKYTKTGMIFGAETALDMSEIVINDGNLDNNLRTFCNTCMMYDLALKLYTFKDLKNETNLLEFLKEKTAKSRYMNYSEDGSARPELISCKEAIEKIDEKLKKGGAELTHQKNKQIFKNLPVAYQAMTQITGDSNEIIKQLLVMSVVSEELSSEAFAKKRAAFQQKSSWKTMGGIADGLIITTRCVIEALIYGAVLFVIPLLFLPSGISYLKTWVWLLVWIQLWPPFYAILDYVSLIAARGQAEGLFDPEKASTCCLSIYNTVGLSSVYSNISAYAKSMKVLIPPLSYAILQGGMGSFVHLTSSMMGASQQAVSQTSADAVSGNYSFANASMSTTSFGNATYSQQNYAPSLNSGYLSKESLGEKIEYASGGTNVYSKLSRLPVGISEERAMQSSLAKNLTSSVTAHEASTRSLNESISNSGRDARDFTSHIAHDLSYSSSNSTSESLEASRSAQYVESQVETFARDHGISSQASWEIFGSVGAGIPLTEIKAGMSTRFGITSNDVFNHAKSVSDSSEFREAFNSVENFAKNFSHNSTDGEGERLANSLTQSDDQLRSDSEQYSATLDSMNQSSRLSSYYENHSLSERQDLTQKILDYAVDERGLNVGQFNSLLNDDSSTELAGIVADFCSSRLPEMTVPEDYVAPESFHATNLETIEQESTVSTTVQMDSPANFSKSTTQGVKDRLSRSTHNEEKIAESREYIREFEKGIKSPELAHSNPSKREIDLEVLWNWSFDEL